MHALMKALDHPEADLRTVHIAGTNGKGSTVAMLDACLRECGYTVGAYTSPHLTDLRERIQINDALIPHAAFTALLSEVARAADTLPKKLGVPTFFELMTAVAILRFAEQAVDVAIFEVGLGGRLDSTNVINPDVTAITSISFDHTHFLGKTLTSIATEKAGIFKPGVPALTIPQEAEVVAALREVATRVEAPFELLGDEIEFSYRFEASPQLGPHTRVGLSTPRCMFEHVPVPLMGEHQALNCGLVLAMLDKLTARGFDLPEPEVIEGLAKTQVPGRMEIVWRDPRILLDGAHNPAAVSALIKSIGAHVPYDSMVMIFGCAADKDVDEMLRRVALGADKVIFTKAKGNPRAMDPHELSRRFNHLSGKMSQIADTLDDALSIAARAAGRDDLVAVTGSFYLVGEAKKLLTLRAEKAGMPELVG
jgi:dihydrofolate synthase/folylpolyglutamate synthase